MLLKLGFVMMAFAVALAGVVTAVVWTDEPARSAALKSAQQGPAEPLKRTNPGVEPWKEKRVDLSAPEKVELDSEPQLAVRNETQAHVETESLREPKPDPEPRPAEPKPAEPLPEPSPEPEPPPEPEPLPEPEPEPRPEPEVGGEPPEPTQGQISSAYEPRRYDLPEGAVLGLTIGAIGLYDVPVFDSVKERALAAGVGHHPETSMPWTDAAQRNVYLAGHRLGYPGTASHLVFYRLNDLGRGDEILLRDRDGKRYRYRVSETFRADPDDSWVMGQVRGRDMVTLQTCIGPDWGRRLIVRAERV